MAQTLTQDDLDAIVAAIRTSFAATPITLAPISITNSTTGAALTIETADGAGIDISTTNGQGILINAATAGQPGVSIQGGGVGLDIRGNTGQGVYIASNAVEGIYVQAGVTGAGLYLQGGSSSGSGLYAKALGNSDQDSGIYATCYGALGSGLYIEAKQDGHGLWAESEGDGDGIHADVEGSGMVLSQDIVDGLLDVDDGIETGLTPRGALRLVCAAMAGKLSGGGTATEIMRNAVADSKARITATVDAVGNRSAITWDAT